jgi:hypothetical protein
MARGSVSAIIPIPNGDAIMATQSGDEGQRLNDLLRQLKDAGAEIKETNSEGVRLTESAQRDVADEGVVDQFNAWVAWPKRF